MLIHDLAPLEISMKEVDHTTGLVTVCVKCHLLDVSAANRKSTHALILIISFSSIISAYCPYPVRCMVWTFSSLYHGRGCWSIEQFKDRRDENRRNWACTSFVPLSLNAAESAFSNSASSSANKASSSSSSEALALDSCTRPMDDLYSEPNDSINRAFVELLSRVKIMCMWMISMLTWWPSFVVKRDKATTCGEGQTPARERKNRSQTLADAPFPRPKHLPPKSDCASSSPQTTQRDRLFLTSTRFKSRAYPATVLHPTLN